jgi:hypothetical protein
MEEVGGRLVSALIAQALRQRRREAAPRTGAPHGDPRRVDAEHGGRPLEPRPSGVSVVERGR